MDNQDTLSLSEIFNVGGVFWYSGDEATFNNGVKHPFFVVFVDKESGEFLAVNGTSQVERSYKRAEYRNYSEGTIVTISKDSYDFLSKDTAIDCNILSLETNMRDIVISEDFSPVLSRLSQDDIDRIILGIKNSKSIAPFYKKKIENFNSGSLCVE